MLDKARMGMRERIRWGLGSWSLWYQCSNYRVNKGDSPPPTHPTTIVVLVTSSFTTIVATIPHYYRRPKQLLLILPCPPRLKRGMGIEKYSISMHFTALYFLLIRALYFIDMNELGELMGGGGGWPTYRRVWEGHRSCLRTCVCEHSPVGYLRIHVCLYLYVYILVQIHMYNYAHLHVGYM